MFFFFFFFFGGGGGVDIWGSSQIWTIYGGHFYSFLGLLLRSRYRMGIFLGLLNFKIYFGVCLLFLIVLKVNV